MVNASRPHQPTPDPTHHIDTVRSASVSGAVAGHLPLSTQRLLIVTGKGGVGKSAVTAALARAISAGGRRVLAVEVGRNRVGTLLGAPNPLGPEPTILGPRLAAASIEAEDALGDFVLSVLRFKLLARRLLESTSFQVLAAAAPGLAEFLILHKLQGWLTARRLGRQLFDVVVVDAPASGHSLPLLAAPQTLGTLARIGPIADSLSSLQTSLRDPAYTLVCIVTTPEEMAVREATELHAELTQRLGLPVAPPIVNAMPPRRFTAEDTVVLDRLEQSVPGHPYLAAARFESARRHHAAAQVKALAAATASQPVRLPFLFVGPEDPEGMQRLTRALADAAGLAA